MTTNDVQYLDAVPVMPVEDATKAIAFYTEKLGFELAFEQGPYAGVTLGDHEIHLDGVVNSAAGEVTTRINVAGVDALYRELERRGVVDPEEPLNTKPWGARQFSVLDCCGNRITFVQFS